MLLKCVGLRTVLLGRTVELLGRTVLLLIIGQDCVVRPCKTVLLRRIVD